MAPLLTVNKLGYISGNPTESDIFLDSESGLSTVRLHKIDRVAIVPMILAGKDSELDAADGYKLNLIFHFGLVTMSWNYKGVQEVVFDEIELMRFLDVSNVRTLILARRAGYL